MQMNDGENILKYHNIFLVFIVFFPLIKVSLQKYLCVLYIFGINRRYDQFNSF